VQISYAKSVAVCSASLAKSFESNLQRLWNGAR
jgi:hypothetical protein